MRESAAGTTTEAIDWDWGDFGYLDQDALDLEWIVEILDTDLQQTQEPPCATHESESQGGTELRPKRRRQRAQRGPNRREEILQLREEVQALEQRMRLLQLRADTNEDGCDVELPSSPPLVANMWRAIAERQSHALDLSQSENRLLHRRVLREQQKLEKLKRAIASALGRDDKRELWPHSGPPTTTASVLDSMEPYLALLACLDTMPYQVEQRFACVATSDERNWSRRFDTFQFPFTFSCVANAAWKLVSSDYSSFDPFLHHDVQSLENGVMNTFVARLTKSRHSGEFRGKTIYRRFVGSNHMLIIAAGWIEPIEVMTVPMEGLALQHLQWTVIEPDNTLSGTTKMRTVVSVVPQILYSAPATKLYIPALAEFSEQFDAFLRERVHQNIENVALSSPVEV